VRLVYIHGPPAVGKLTIAKEVARLVPARLFNNHAPIDLAHTVFEHGAPGFWSFVASARVRVLEVSAKEDVPIVLMTSCDAEPHDRPAFETYEHVLKQYTAGMCPVFLHWSNAEMKRRVPSLDRKARGEISSVSGPVRFLDQYNHVPVPHTQCLEIATDEITATEAARKNCQTFQQIGIA